MGGEAWSPAICFGSFVLASGIFDGAAITYPPCVHSIHSMRKGDYSLGVSLILIDRPAQQILMLNWLRIWNEFLLTAQRKKWIGIFLIRLLVVLCLTFTYKFSIFLVILVVSIKHSDYFNKKKLGLKYQ